ncbi:sensor histidine kinase [Actinomyces sp.]|uniref:sensor histidine kinase n=1 Tax=Actinomyces sp. TaxID=29317 RepID=UPI0026DB677D|nr:histidine kinase [Actinomyces sp.]MDO4900373.1 histidine kinase [Actinomyces sp.]
MAELGEAIASTVLRARTALLRPPEPLPSRRIYVIIGAVVGIGNFAANWAIRSIPAPIDMVFIVVAAVIVTLLPLHPRPGVLVYLCCWTLLILLPNTDLSDMLFASVAFAFFLGRFFRPLPAFSWFLAALFIEILILTSSGISGADLSNALGSTGFLVILGALLIPLGALVRFIEASRLADAEHADAQLEEMRLDIAREMHDLVAYSMSQTALRAQRAAADASYPAAARDEFAALEATASDALHELRLLLRTLRQPATTQEPPIATGTGLGGVVTDLATAVSAVSADVSAAGFEITYHCRGEAALTRIQATTLSRVAREMGANIIRHADPGAPVTMTLSLGPQVIRLVATNRVRATDAHLPRSGTGLLGMRERLATIGGTLTTLAEDGSWMVTATVPVAEPRNIPSPPENQP